MIIKILPIFFMIFVTYFYYPYLGGNTGFFKHRLSSNLQPGEQRNQQVRSLLMHGGTTPRLPQIPLS